MPSGDEEAAVPDSTLQPNMPPPPPPQAPVPPSPSPPPPTGGPTADANVPMADAAAAVAAAAATTAGGGRAQRAPRPPNADLLYTKRGEQYECNTCHMLFTRHKWGQHQAAITGPNRVSCGAAYVQMGQDKRLRLSRQGGRGEVHCPGFARQPWGVFKLVG
jgi:hypothetical protein